MADVKRPVGRPSGYSKEIQEKSDEYLISGYTEIGGVIPSVSGLACYLGVSRSTVHKWRDEYPEFSGTLDGIEAMQEHLTLNNGLTGAFNSTIAKLVLANHGYSDKQALDHTSSDGSLSPTRIVIEAASDDRDDTASS